MKQGYVIWFNDAKGFGFLRPDGANEGDGLDVFVHYSAIDGPTSRRRTLLQGQKVEYDEASNEKGRYAVLVRVVV